MLPVVTRVAELLHEGLDMSDRQTRLMARLEVGLPAGAADLAVHLGGRIARGDYLRLLDAGLDSVHAVDAAEDAALLETLGGDERKLRALRAAVRASRAPEDEDDVLMPILPPPED